MKSWSCCKELWAWACMLALWGCSGRCPLDSDNAQGKALRIAPGVLVKDSIAAKCDREDWKDFSYYQDARVTVTFAIGELYRPHGVTGEITLFDFKGNVLQRQPVVPEQRDYTFVFTAEKERSYFFHILATRGSAPYMVETKVEPLDPCAACPAGTTCCRPTGLCCEPGTICRQGACVRADTCEPSCGPGFVCVMGQCEEACPGGCKRGWRCDEASRTCVREAKGSTPKAPTELPPPPQPPRCGPGETYNPATKRCETQGGVISGTVLSATDKAGGVEILINRGSAHGVKAGATGSVAGVRFQVQSVSATRCKAIVKGVRASDLINKPVQISP